MLRLQRLGICLLLLLTSPHAHTFLTQAYASDSPSTVDTSAILGALQPSLSGSPFNNSQPYGVTRCGSNLHASQGNRSSIYNGTRWQAYSPTGYYGNGGTGQMLGVQIFETEVFFAGGAPGAPPSNSTFLLHCARYSETHWYGFGDLPWLARADHAMLMWQGRVFIMGGRTGDDSSPGLPQVLNDVWSFPLSTWNYYSSNWIQHSNADWDPRHSFGAAVHGDAVFVTSGKLGVDKFANDVWMWSHMLLPWVKLDQAPWTIRYNLLMASVNGWLVVVGGEDSLSGRPSHYLRDAFVYDGTNWVNNTLSFFQSNPATYSNLTRGSLLLQGQQLWIFSNADNSAWTAPLPVQGPSPVAPLIDSGLAHDIAYEDLPGTYPEPDTKVLGLEAYQAVILLCGIFIILISFAVWGLWTRRKRDEEELQQQRIEVRQIPATELAVHVVPEPPSDEHLNAAPEGMPRFHLNELGAPNPLTDSHVILRYERRSNWLRRTRTDTFSPVTS